MKYIEVKTTPIIPGNEWNVTSYPGDGLYMTGVGLIAVGSGMCTGMTNVTHLVRDGAPEDTGSGSSGLAQIDIHKLIDQISGLLKPESR